MRPWRTVLLFVLAASLLIAFAAAAQQPKRAPRPKPPAPSAPVTPAPPPKVERPVPFKAGETLEYEISWSGSVTAGSATVRVVDKRPSLGSTAWDLVADGRPTPFLAALYPVYYKAETLVDAYTLLPQQSTLYSEEGKRRRNRIVTFHPDTSSATLEIKTATLVQQTFKIPPGTLDTMSALFAIRALPFREGLTLTMPVADGDDVYEVRVSVGPRETVDSRLGPQPAWRVTPNVISGTGQMKGRTITVWISDDPRRLPLKMEADMPIGKFVISLTDTRG
jgi:uncharacterized protein DUF3108